VNVINHLGKRGDESIQGFGVAVGNLMEIRKFSEIL